MMRAISGCMSARRLPRHINSAHKEALWVILHFAVDLCISRGNLDQVLAHVEDDVLICGLQVSLIACGRRVDSPP